MRYENYQGYEGYQSAQVPKEFAASVLIVDDCPEVVRTLAFVLSKLNCKFDVAYNGFEALDQLSHNNYDLIILDWMMPQMDGYETLQEAQELFDENKGRKIAALPFVIYSSLETADVWIPNCPSFVFSGHLDKVDTIPVLMGNLADVLGLKR